MQSLCPRITGDVCCSEDQFDQLRTQVQQVDLCPCLLFSFICPCIQESSLKCYVVPFLLLDPSATMTLWYYNFFPVFQRWCLWCTWCAGCSFLDRLSSMPSQLLEHVLWTVVLSGSKYDHQCYSHPHSKRHFLFFLSLLSLHSMCEEQSLFFHVCDVAKLAIINNIILPNLAINRIWK